jgi:hypothetical protein
VKKLIARISGLSADRLVRIACYIGIVSLLLMSWSALVPAALPIVVGMSLGQTLGVVAFLFYVLAILYEMRRKAPPEPHADVDESAEAEDGVSLDAD